MNVFEGCAAYYDCRRILSLQLFARSLCACVRRNGCRGVPWVPRNPPFASSRGYTVDTHALSAVNTFIRCLMMICQDKNLIKTHTHKTQDTKLEVDKGKVILQW